MLFLTAIDLDGNEIQNVTIQNLDIKPSNPKAGQIIYNSTTNKIEYYNSTEWVTIDDLTIQKLDTAENGYSTSYQMIKNGTPIGDKINIPKDLVVESGSVKTVESENTPVEGYIVGDKYIDLVIANSNDQHIYILVSDLVDNYELPVASTDILGGVKIDGATININDDGVISGVGTKIITDGKIGEIFNNNNTAIGACSHAEGYKTTASGDDSHAEGASTTASGGSSHAEGASTTASGNYSHAEGCHTIASGDYSHAEGWNSVAKGYCSHAEGAIATEPIITKDEYGNITDITSGHMASGDYSHVEGYVCIASGDYSHAEGYACIVSGDYSHAEGYACIVSGGNSHVEGTGSIVSGQSSHAEGAHNIASGEYSHAEGYTCIASGPYSHAEGAGNIAFKKGSHAEGFYSVATGIYSHAEGSGTTAPTITRDTDGNITDVTGKHIASGQSSHVEGNNNIASGPYSHAEGTGTTASSPNSHAEGAGTTASGYTSHAEGIGTTASGSISHAEGANTTAIGTGSHAEGTETIANGNFQHVQGKYNIADADSKYAFIIGNGTNSDNRSNAFAIDWNGNIYQNNSETGINLNDLKTTTDSITISRLETAEDGYSVTYQMMKDGLFIGDKINIPKDLVVESGTVKECTIEDTPVEGYIVGDKYIDLVIANSNDQHIYILVSDLVDKLDLSDYYTKSEIDTALSSKADNITATTTTAGLMSAEDKSKLDKILIVPKLQLDDILVKGTKYQLGELTGDITITLPTSADDDIEVDFAIGSTVYNITCSYLSLNAVINTYYKVLFSYDKALNMWFSSIVSYDYTPPVTEESDENIDESTGTESEVGANDETA